MVQAEPIKVLTENRQARHNYIVLERYEAGLVLTGTEVKAARAGMVQLKDAYAQIRDNEAWLINAHISPYSHGNRQNHDPLRDRKLLLHRREIDKLLGRTRDGGLTIVPLRLYLKKGLIKCELALARARRMHDKRALEREREREAEARQALREAQRRARS
ncbi:MAG: SsrA-binding protein SmpB [Bryobacterales bacterium]|nr:SsrA-binding protein SmpB [Bryobacteraceae bacterium]MDW8131809.1 SsrA-binding protein SmpB [Bryobacterales bacterium]